MNVKVRVMGKGRVLGDLVVPLFFELTRVRSEQPRCLENALDVCLVYGLVRVEGSGLSE